MQVVGWGKQKVELMFIYVFHICALLYQLNMAVPSGSSCSTYDTINKDTSVVLLSHQLDMVPRFRDGSKALDRYIRNNLRWPAAGICFEGTIIVSLVIEKDGSVADVCSYARGFVPFEREAERVVSNMPCWIPGRLNNQPVRSQIGLPIRFRIE